MPITTKVVSSHPAHGAMYSMQYYVMKFVSDLLKVALNTIFVFDTFIIATRPNVAVQNPDMYYYLTIETQTMGFWKP